MVTSLREQEKFSTLSTAVLMDVHIFSQHERMEKSLNPAEYRHQPLRIFQTINSGERKILAFDIAKRDIFRQSFGTQAFC